MAKIVRYTKEQEELILKNAYTKGKKLSYQELAIICNRTVEGIRKKELDLKRKHLHNKRVNSSKWTKEEEDIIRNTMLNGDFSVTNILKDKRIKKDIKTIEAKALDVSIEIQNKGKVFSRGGRAWTKEEEDYLTKWYGIERPIIIGIHLGRNMESLHLKAKRLKLGGKKIFYTARECASILGMTDSTFLYYVHRKLIKSRRAVTEQLIHQIRIEDLYEFMEKYQDKWDSRNMAYEPFLLDKPDWYIEKCKRDRENPIGYLDTQKKWTNEDIKTLYSMKEEGYSYKEIAEKLNRTIQSVENKWRKRHEAEKRKQARIEKEKEEATKRKQKETLNRLIEEADNEKSYIERKVYKVYTKSFTEDDIELLSNLRMVGFNNSEIGEMVGKNMETVRRALTGCKDKEYVVDIKSNTLTKEEKRDLFNKANEDYSIYELCLEFKKNYYDIIKYYEEVLKEIEKETYIDGNKIKTWTKEDEDNLMKWKSEGLSNRVIAKKLGKTESSIRTRIAVIKNRNKNK